MKRGHISLQGAIRYAVPSAKAVDEENEGIAYLRIARVQVRAPLKLFYTHFSAILVLEEFTLVSCGTQEAIVQIMKMRKKVSAAALQTELVAMLANLFTPTMRLIKEQIEWLIENKYMQRDENDPSTFIYLA